MIELYHCVSARSFRPLWMLEELCVPYRLRMLPFPPRVHARQYLEDNPLGTVPLMKDGATRMTESAAMCQYLAARHGGRRSTGPRWSRAWTPRRHPICAKHALLHESPRRGKLRGAVRRARARFGTGPT